MLPPSIGTGVARDARPCPPFGFVKMTRSGEPRSKSTGGNAGGGAGHGRARLRQARSTSRNTQGRFLSREARSMKILMADDNHDSVDSRSRLLEAHGPVTAARRWTRSGGSSPMSRRSRPPHAHPRWLRQRARHEAGARRRVDRADGEAAARADDAPAGAAWAKWAASASMNSRVRRGRWRREA